MFFLSSDPADLSWNAVEEWMSYLIDSKKSRNRKEVLYNILIELNNLG
jgi:hypothetical protein